MIEVKRLLRWDSWIILAVILLVWACQTNTIHYSWNESSRLAAIESLVERATWRIDASPYGHQTGDKVVLDGHYYSDKPPLFAAIGAVFYALLRYGLGANLAIDGCQPGTICVYYWLTVLMVGVPSALLAALFYRFARRRSNSSSWALGLTLLLCFGTVVWPYSVTFNHHLPAAVFLFISFYWLFDSQPSHLKLFGAGISTGLAVAFDLTSAFLALAFFVIVATYHRQRLVYFIGGGLIPSLLMLVFNYQITGAVFPPYFFDAGYNFPGSEWTDRNTTAALHRPDSVLLNAFQGLVGHHGMLVYWPLLIFALAGLAQAVKWLDRPVMVKSIWVALGLTGHLLFIFTQDAEFGGDAYGVRYFIPAIPILYTFIVMVAPSRFYQPGGRWVFAVWIVAALISLFSAYQGMRAGAWQKTEPPLFLALNANFPYLTLKSNLTLPSYQSNSNHRRQPHRQFTLPPIKQRLDINVNNEVMLLGYDMSTRRVQPGQNLTITLYWQLLRVTSKDYFIFSHLLDANRRQWGELDRRLQEGYPLAFWYPGEIVADRREIPIKPEAAAGLVWLHLGAYEIVNDKIEPLPLLMASQTGAESSFTIGPILIGDPERALRRGPITPQTSLIVKLGEPPVIALRGYDLFHDETTLKLKLYWESLAPTPVDWTIFAHLRDKTGQIVAQKDGPAGGGSYPTSFWNTGEVIVDEAVLPRPTLSGQGGQLIVGLYDLQTGARLVTPGWPANEILLAEDIGK